MEFWLTFNNREETLQLPIPPPEFKINEGNIVNIVNINDVGEVLLIGKSKLATIELSSFFPNQNYSFCQYTGFPSPYDCVSMIRRWRTSGKPIRLLITNTDVNLACAIEGFTYSESGGSRDVYFNLTLKEYRFLRIYQSGSDWQSSNRSVERATPESYEIKDGDSLWVIAKKYLGDGSLAYSLAEKNNILDPGLIYPGQVIVL